MSRTFSDIMNDYMTPAEIRRLVRAQRRFLELLDELQRKRQIQAIDDAWEKENFE